MSKRIKPCPDCGDAIVLARAPNGGWMRLAPYPDSAGAYRVDVLSDLVVLPAGAPSSGWTKRYERHVCVTARKAVPRGGRPEQMVLGDA